MLYDIADDTSLSIEAQVARNLGDDDWEDLATETPRWQSGGSCAKAFERDRMRFDDARPNQDWSN